MDEKELQVKIMIYIMGKSLEEIAKIDKDFQEDLEDIQGVIQWKVGNIRAYQILKEGKYSFVMDEETEDPELTMILKDLDFAKKFFNGEVDGTSAFMSGDLKIEGDLQLAMSYGTLAEHITEYLEPMRPS
jgi:putative sterol carrier protein